ncbi:MAG: GLPGLI family protein [Saprospiraceae bacterium]|nr:GLPGLI family protein [Saprospiraceae bacterium]
MKPLSIFILLLTTNLLCIAQPSTSGKIVFKETIKLNLDFGENNDRMAKMVPSSQSVDKVLYFKEEQSLFKNLDKANDLEVKHEEDGNDFQLVMKMPESIIYIDKKNDEYIQSQDLMGKEFLIVDKPIKYNWKLTGEQKTILNYTCQKAILIDTSKNVAAWFTSQIPIAYGPAGMMGLPGMILALESEDGDRMSIATSIEPLSKDFEFTKPSKGKKVSKAEYEKIRDAKMKEMGAVDGKGGGIKMIIREERN